MPCRVVNDHLFANEDSNPIVGKLFEEAKKEKVLIGKGGLYGNVVRISPALNISKTEVDEFLRVMDHALAKC